MVINIQRRWRAHQEVPSMGKLSSHCDGLIWLVTPTSVPFAHVRDYAARRRRWDAARRNLSRAAVATSCSELRAPARTSTAASPLTRRSVHDGSGIRTSSGSTVPMLRLSVLEVAQVTKMEPDAPKRKLSAETVAVRRSQIDWLTSAVDALATARNSARGAFERRRSSVGDMSSTAVAIWA